MPLDPNSTFAVSDERLEGVLESYNPLTLGLSDDDISLIVGNRVTAAEQFWNQKLDLDNQRKINESFWDGSYSKETDGYTYDKKYYYKNPRIFLDIESLIPKAIAKAPQPVVVEANDTDASRELAQELGDTLLAHYEDGYFKSKFHMVARHLLIGYHLGTQKLRWNDELGEYDPKSGEPMGDVEVHTLRPQRVVIGEEAKDHDSVKLVAEYMDATVEELGYKFKEKKDHIMTALAAKYNQPPQMSKRVGYLEVWFSYFDKDGKPKEAVMWKLENLVLGSMKNPNWNYDEIKRDNEGNAIPTNFFRKPQKPYIFYNYLNSGKYLLDDVTLTSQAKTLQRIHDKRGKQIVKDADQADSGTLYNTEMVDPKDISKLIGDPEEKLGVTGDVRKAAMRLPRLQLEPFVMQDKLDARAQIDDIFGVHAPMKGEATNSPTLGQEVLSQRGDTSRAETLATSIEDGADRLYKYMTQMMKVFYDKPRNFKVPEGGSTKHIIGFDQNKIEFGTKVRVKTGSVLPDDPFSKAQETIQLLAALDPLSIAEGLGKPNPKDFAKRLLYFKAMPDKYITEILGVNPDDQANDPQALEEHKRLMQGEAVPPQQSPSQNHLATHTALMQAPEFAQFPPEIQANVGQHVEAEVQNAKQALGETPTQEQPTNPAMEQPQTGGPQQPQSGEPQSPGLLKRLLG